MEETLVHLFHSLPRQDCSLQDKDTGRCSVQPALTCEVTGALLQERNASPGISLVFLSVIFLFFPPSPRWLLRHHLASCFPSVGSQHVSPLQRRKPARANSERELGSSRAGRPQGCRTDLGSRRLDTPLPSASSLMG